MFKKLLNTKISKQNKKGFTLAELLIVVAIIGVLVAISIPIFTTQLEKSREATDLSNVRSAYAQVVADYLTNSGTSSYTKTISVTAKQQKAGWQTDGSNSTTTIGTSIGSQGTVTVPARTSGNTYKVTVNKDGAVSVN